MYTYKTRNSLSNWPGCFVVIDYTHDQVIFREHISHQHLDKGAWPDQGIYN